MFCSGKLQFLFFSLTLCLLWQICSEREEKQSQTSCEHSARDQERNYAPRVLHTDTFVLFRSTGNSVIFAAEFCAFVFKYKRDSLTNFRAQKARENLRRENGAEVNRRVFEKTEGRWGKKRYGAILFCHKTCCFITRIMVRENPFSYSFIVI